MSSKGSIPNGMEPYAEFLEKVCKSCAEEQPISGAFVSKCKDGTVYSSYFGEAIESPYVKMELANMLQTDGMYQVMQRNARDIVDAAEDDDDDG